MGVQKLRVALNSVIFPLYSEAAGMTIIQPEIDENWDRNNAANTSPDKGVPQVFYMHNVLPIAEGFQAIGYSNAVQAPSGASNFDDCFVLISPDGTRCLLSPAGGTNWIFDPSVGSWVSVKPLASNLINSTTIVTTAYINGQTYFCYSGIGVFIYDIISQTIIQQTLISLNASSVLGITATNGYMIAWSTNTVVWSSLVNPLDFTASIQTGAGGGQIQQAKGKINFCIAVSGGFIAYCDLNAVGAAYTNNVNYPFIFQEIIGSGGCTDPHQVAYQDNLSYHYVLNTDGIQQISLTQAVSVFPEITDFLGAQIFEDFNETTVTFTSEYLTSQVNTKLSCVANRFLIFSYGTFQSTNQYTHAIVFDLTLGRYGKLKTNHTCFFQYVTPIIGTKYNALTSTQISSFSSTFRYQDFFSPLVLVPEKQSLALLRANGNVAVVNFGLSETTADGVFILGKYQLKRTNFIRHHRTMIESVNPGATISAYILPTLDGKTFELPVALTPITESGLTIMYGGRVTAQNISLCLIGQMNLTSIVLEIDSAGYR